MQDQSRTNYELLEENLLLKQRIQDFQHSPSAAGRAINNFHNSGNITNHPVNEMTIIAEIGRIISSSLDIESVYERFAEETCKLIPFDRIGVSLNDPESGTVEIAYMSGIPIAGHNAGASFPLAGSFHEELIRTRTGFIVDTSNFEEYAKRSRAALSSYKAGTRSILYVPLIFHGKVIGGLNFRSKTLNAYAEQDLFLAQRIGDQIAGAIANAQLYTNLKREKHEKAIIAEIGRIISSSLNIEKVYERFATEVKKLIPCDRLAICLHDTPTNTVTIAYLFGLDISIKRKGEWFPLNGTVSELIQQTGKGHLFNPNDIEEVANQFPCLIGSYKIGMRSMITVPLISRDIIFGDLSFRSTNTKTYTEDHFRLAQQIGNQIAGAIANAQLFKKLETAESSLRESESRFKAIFDQAAVGVAEVRAP